jgi:general secretion pathway protein K
VALVTALLVVALAAVATAALARHQQLAIQRSANLLNAEQAYLYAVGAEAFARQVLRRDAEDGPIDHPFEAWATLVPPTHIDGGDLVGRLDDLQGRFNLNNLVDGNGPVTDQVALLQRLLARLELQPDVAWSVVDWLDGDQEPSPSGGAEDLDYLRLDPAYRTAGRLLTSPSELLLIDGFDMAAYQRLAPHVTALPGPAPLNVNTASTLLLQALADDITPDLAERLADGRDADGYAGIDLFLDEVEALSDEEVREAVAALPLTVGSSHFLFTGEARFGRGRVRLASLLRRDPGGAVTTLRRSRGAL